MDETRLHERTVTPAAKPGLRPPRPEPPIPMFREFPWWRHAKRFHVEHWVAGAIVLVAFANAVRLLAF